MRRGLINGLSVGAIGVALNHVDAGVSTATYWIVMALVIVVVINTSVR